MNYKDYIERNNNSVWFAVESDDDDIDWGVGSFNLEEAKKMLKDYPNGKIAVIKMGEDPICIAEIPYSIAFEKE